MQRAQTLSQLKGRPRDTRPSASKRGYGSRWKKVRARQLRIEPLCRLCSNEGIIKVANVVDHIIPHKGNSDLMWSSSNHQSLCTPCHNSKTAREDGGFGNEIKGKSNE